MIHWTFAVQNHEFSGRLTAENVGRAERARDRSQPTGAIVPVESQPRARPYLTNAMLRVAEHVKPTKRTKVQPAHPLTQLHRRAPQTFSPRATQRELTLGRRAKNTATAAPRQRHERPPPNPTFFQPHNINRPQTHQRRYRLP